MKLKIAILSRNTSSYSTDRLWEACRKAGHTARVFDTLGVSLLVETGKRQLFYRQRSLRGYKAVIPRIGASVSAYGTAVVRQFEHMGVFTLNSADAIRASRDKLRALQALSRHGIAVPSTAFVFQRQGARAAIEQVGGAPVVIKLTEGSHGSGVMLADTMNSAEAIWETLMLARQSVVVQKFVSESRGYDLRAFVIGERVIAAMLRRAAPDEYRSNVHRGGRVERVRLIPEVERTAVRAAQILGLRVAGVDLIESENGPLVLEVNSSPGLEGIERATGIDVAGAVVEHLEREISFPDVDLRQRLTAGGGYEVVELQVGEASGLAGLPLEACRFAEKRVLVLSLARAGGVFPNPRADLVVEPGDTLLCFGPDAELRTLLDPGRASNSSGAHEAERSP